LITTPGRIFALNVPADPPPCVAPPARESSRQHRRRYAGAHAPASVRALGSPANVWSCDVRNPFASRPLRAYGAPGGGAECFMSPSPEMVHVDGTIAQRAPSPLLLARKPRTCKLEAAGDNRAPAAWRGGARVAEGAVRTSQGKQHHVSAHVPRRTCSGTNHQLRRFRDNLERVRHHVYMPSLCLLPHYHQNNFVYRRSPGGCTRFDSANASV
jgi:hypothetical protein